MASRAFYTAQGTFFSMLGTVAEELTQAKFVFCFDGKANWRKQIYPEYKSNRNDPNKALRIAFFRTIWSALHATGHVCVYRDELEADDLLAVYAPHFDPAVILTSDKDLLGLVGEGTAVYLVPGTFAARHIVDEARFMQEWGFFPKNFYVWKALVGDAGDNIKGVRGIGPKTATRLVQTHGKEVFAEPQSSKVGKLLASQEVAYRVALNLVTPRIIDMPTVVPTEYNKEAVVVWQKLKSTQLY